MPRKTRARAQTKERWTEVARQLVSEWLGGKSPHVGNLPRAYNEFCRWLYRWTEEQMLAGEPNKDLNVLKHRVNVQVHQLRPYFGTFVQVLEALSAKPEPVETEPVGGPIQQQKARILDDLFPDEKPVRNPVRKPALAKTRTRIRYEDEDVDEDAGA